MKYKAKILIVAMVDSIHTARWLSQLEGFNYDLYLFPSINVASTHEMISKNSSIKYNYANSFLRRLKIPSVIKKLSILYKNYRSKRNPSLNVKKLYSVINSIKPDIIHSLETQNAGYLVSQVKSQYFQNKKFPIWWHTNWGSDIYLFGRLPEHREKIKEVITNADYYSCECDRDVQLALEFGFKGEVLPVYPNTGGFKISNISELRKTLVLPSARKLIMLKGYQGWAGRAFVGLRALARASDLLKGFELVVYSNSSEEMKIATTLFSQDTGIPVNLLTHKIDHAEILKYHGLARISIGLSISDSISTSVLEAMAMGSFPIQSWTSAADEWLENGKTGFLVPPEDPDVIEKFIRRAITDNDLVDNAFLANWETVKSRLDFDELKMKTLNSYNRVLKGIIK